ncbi:hypothetical protein FPHYL_6910 [Fusarium phyllophilum]|uniref:Uncharacterized protein n=1 Tax=Fusarium phyllophilum TaxID=47803 RepID=A0A8H5NCN1_9HYPO|nr:hypothetical protein FPHYL_6910 [Fusarium phyllophilum]
MKSSAAILLSCVAFVTANFDLYIGQQTGTTPEGGNEDMWNIYPSDPSCSDVYTARNYFGRDDVSGQIGVRCDGAGCFGGNSPADVDVLEMHFGDNPKYHWTIYKDRNYDMYGLDENVYGNCVPFPGNEYSCNQGQAIFDGVRKFRCITEFTVDQIEAAE